jgi:hypothetical protein
MSKSESSRKTKFVPERAPYGDVLSEDGKIRADLQRALFDLGPQATSQVAHPRRSPGVPRREKVPSRPQRKRKATDDVVWVTRDSGLARREREKLEALARKCAEAVKALPGWRYDEDAALEGDRKTIQHPWVQETYRAERKERNRREGVGLPPPDEEPATEIVRETLAHLREISARLRENRRRRLDAVTQVIQEHIAESEVRRREAQRAALEEDVKENQQRAPSERLSLRELARRHGVHHKTVKRLEDRLRDV